MRLRLLPILFCLIIAGCLKPQPQLRPAKSVEELASALARTSQQFRTLRGTAKFRLFNNGNTMALSQVFLVQRPDKLRAEALNPFGFGSPLLVMTADGERLAVNIPTQGSYYKGEATPANLARFTQMPLRLEDLIGILLYDVPRFPFTEASTSVVDDYDRLELRGDGGVVQSYLFDTGGLLIRADLQINSESRLSISYGEFGEVDRYPRSISLAIPPRNVEVTLNFTEVAVNIDIPLAKFKQTPPQGAKIQTLQ